MLVLYYLNYTYVLICELTEKLSDVFGTSGAKAFKFLGVQYYSEESLKTISKIFTATAPTIYSFVNNYEGNSLVLGYCYGGVSQDKWGAQLFLSFNDCKIRFLNSGTWKNFVKMTPVVITATANSDWISWGALTGFSIMGKFFLSCPEFQFAKSESFGNGDNALLWTLSTDTGIYGRVFYVHTGSRMVRLRIDGNTVRGHYDTPSTGDVFTVNEFFG